MRVKLGIWLKKIFYDFFIKRSNEKVSRETMEILEKGRGFLEVRVN